MSSSPHTASPRQLDLGIAILRVVTGVIFIAHGAQKVFLLGFDGVAAGFAQAGIPMAGIVGPLVALAELVGGIALVIGFLTRFASLGLSLVMLGALFFVHLAAGFFLPAGFEFVLMLIAALSTLALVGAGAFSVDHALAGRRVEVTDLPRQRRAA